MRGLLALFEIDLRRALDLPNRERGALADFLRETEAQALADGLSGEQLAATRSEPAPELEAARAECAAARPDAGSNWFTPGARSLRSGP